MNFIKTKNTTEIKLNIQTDSRKASKIQEDLIIIVNNLNPAEINLLAKAVQKPMVKMAALQELKKLNL